ncbi:Uncharacterised protein [Klebsiella pneumoniae]|nr:Uncharacterised protein [Klebsiella pneumoniae]
MPASHTPAASPAAHSSGTRTAARTGARQKRGQSSASAQAAMSWKGPYQSGNSSMLCTPMGTSSPQASCRAGSVSRQGRARQASQSASPHAARAKGSPSSTASCSGRLWALSTSRQKRLPG